MLIFDDPLAGRAEGHLYLVPYVVGGGYSTVTASEAAIWRILSLPSETYDCDLRAGIFICPLRMRRIGHGLGGRKEEV